jgi:hypothetical protein
MSFLCVLGLIQLESANGQGESANGGVESASDHVESANGGGESASDHVESANGGGESANGQGESSALTGYFCSNWGKFDKRVEIYLLGA